MCLDFDFDSVFFLNEKCLKLDLKWGFYDVLCLFFVFVGWWLELGEIFY